MIDRARQIVYFALGLLLLAGCRQQQPTATDVQLSMTISDRLVGESTLLVKVTDSDGKPLADPGQLAVRGDMDHAGMAPVLAESASAVDGVFTLPFEWTMGGGWIVEASLTLPDGSVATETFLYQILAEAGRADTTSMDHEAMTQGDAASGDAETSAAYMRVSNHSESDISIVSVTSAAASHIAFHETVVEDDMARMQALDSLRIPAGETVELAPGGKHVMLMGLNADLAPEGQLALQLLCDSGEVYDLQFKVMAMRMNELGDALQIGDLTFSNRWARPAQAGMMDRADLHMRATPSN